MSKLSENEESTALIEPSKSEKRDEIKIDIPNPPISSNPSRSILIQVDRENDIKAEQAAEKPSTVNSAIWSGVDSRLMLFVSQICFSLISLGFGMYLIIDHDKNEGYMTFGSSLIMFILGFLTKNPVIKRKKTYR